MGFCVIKILHLNILCPVEDHFEMLRSLHMTVSYNLYWSVISSKFLSFEVKCLSNKNKHSFCLSLIVKKPDLRMLFTLTPQFTICWKIVIRSVIARAPLMIIQGYLICSFISIDSPFPQSMISQGYLVFSFISIDTFHSPFPQSWSRWLWSFCIV